MQVRSITGLRKIFISTILECDMNLIYIYIINKNDLLKINY